jgi:hypothetical protein
MKKWIVLPIIGLFLVSVPSAFAGKRNVGAPGKNAAGSGSVAAPQGSAGGGMDQWLIDLPAEPVSDLEAEHLTFMREEEKLARDVYAGLFEIWGQPIFDRISQSESRHMEAMRVLLDKYGLPDPVVDDTPGAFSDPLLQELYAELMDLGGQSLSDALTVGCIIEDLDILDNIVAISESDNADIRTAFQNLLKGSRNHLRSFFGALLQAGGTYEARYISPEEMADILASPRERGAVDADGLPVSPAGGGKGRESNGGTGTCPAAPAEA